MDPKSIFGIEILRFGFGFGYFINFTKQFILIKEGEYSLLVLVKESLVLDTEDVYFDATSANIGLLLCNYRQQNVNSILNV